MSPTPESTQARGFGGGWVRFALIWPAIIVASFLILFQGNLAAIGAFFAELVAGPWRPHAPTLALIGAASAPILIHLGALIVALVIGAVQMAGVKGTTIHRVLGWVWVIAFVISAAASFFIRPGHFGALQAIATGAIIAAPLSLVLARLHHVRLHQRLMNVMYFGQILLVGLFAFSPGRLLYKVFFG